jgi:hypothetical protein
MCAPPPHVGLQAELHGQVDALSARLTAHEAAEVAGDGVATQQDLQVGTAFVHVLGARL